LKNVSDTKLIPYPSSHKQKSPRMWGLIQFFYVKSLNDFAQM